MHRVLTAAAVVLIAAFGLAAPASATSPEPTVDVVVGFHDGTFVVNEVAAGEAPALIEAAEAVPEVAYAELDVPMHAVEVTPNDTLYSQQWGPAKVRAPEAWAVTTGSPSTVVAVLDTGVDPNHPDLSGALLPGQDFVDDGRSGDPNGHGTGVAGVLAARGNNAQGVAGYCWSCRILPVRVLDADGAGSAAGVAAGIRWAADNGADIINLSLAGPATSKPMEDAIRYARKKRIIVVAAAGNETEPGQDLTAVQYPAASPGVIGVVATNSSDTVYEWSYRGTWADVTAPGCAVTTRPVGIGIGYGIECGTSFAAPAVAGIIALAMAAYPQATTAVLESSIPATSAPVAGGIAAAGRVDAAAVLESLSKTYGTAGAAQRLAGDNRIATAVTLSQQVRKTAPAVIVARADNYADALAAAPLAGKLDAPVLLTSSTALATAVADEVKRLGATDAWLVGGTGALGPQVESGLRAAGVTKVERLAGANRVETAGLIARQVGGTSVFAAHAGSWADAVAVSGLAALTQTPIVLVETDGVPGATWNALSDLGATEVTVIGGPGVVRDSVLGVLRSKVPTVTRLAGNTRYETSKAIADASLAAGASSVTTWMATGRDWPDALAAGPASAVGSGVLLLVDGVNTTASSPAATWLSAQEGANLIVVGGAASVTDAVFATLASLL